jgi:hypothetical protein
MSAVDWNLTDVLLNDLLSHPHEWRALGRLYLSDVPSEKRCVLVRDAMEVGRRRGLQIEGDRRRGYRFVRFQHRPERSPQPPSGQLRLKAGVA